MKLKYYLRTLGLGIFVTALLMGFATTPKEQESRETAVMDNSETLSKVLSDIASASEEGDTDEAEETQPEEGKTGFENENINPAESKKESKDSAQAESEKESKDSAQAETKEESKTLNQVETEKESEDLPRSEPHEESGVEESDEQMPVGDEQYSQQESGFVELEIRRGDSSDKVSRMLAELGVIEDAKSFDRFLCQNGYDKRISVGSYSIPQNSSEEEIALIISGKKK